MSQIQPYKEKRMINVCLDINNTASWTGTQFDAIFAVDLKRIVQNPDDLNRPYRVSFSYYMMAGTLAQTGLVTTNQYAVEIDFKRNTFTQNLNRAKNYMGNLSVNYVNTAATPTLNQLIARPNDNFSFCVDTLANINEIHVTTLTITTAGGAAATTFAGTDANTKYQVYLNFEEC
jgi:hypothetical protein